MFDQTTKVGRISHIQFLFCQRFRQSHKFIFRSSNLFIKLISEIGLVIQA